MKKIILILVVLITSLSVYSQKMNYDGLKMVKEVIINDDKRMRQRFVYDYGDNNEMISLTVYDCYNEPLRKYYKENGKIKYRGYDMYTNCISYDIKTDKYGNITFVDAITYNDDKTPHERKTYAFTYIYENEMFRPSQFKICYYVYSRENKNFVKSSFENISNIIEDDGLYGNDSAIESDKEHINDTNISFYGILCPTITTDLNIDYLTLTDWINLRSNYFIKYKNIKHLDYKYIYDTNGNVIQINGFFYGNVVTKIDITYVT